MTFPVNLDLLFQSVGRALEVLKNERWCSSRTASSRCSS